MLVIYMCMLYEKQVIVTTFLTATNLPEMEPQLNFSHILIDEGAQTREPEALGALAIAKPETKIVIVGDNKQVGSLWCTYMPPLHTTIIGHAD